MKSQYLYRIYGLTIRSNRPLCGLMRAPEGAEIDAQLHLTDEQPQAFAAIPQEVWQVPPSRYLREEEAFRAWTIECADGCYYWSQYTYEDHVGKQLINPSGSEVFAFWDDAQQATPENIFSGVVKPVLGSLLRIRGITCLHANVVVVDGRAIALLGQSGAGKSTTTAALLSRGHTMLTDDIAAITEDDKGFLVQPGFPSLSLLPITVESFFGSSASFPRVYSFDDKRYVKLASPGVANGHSAEWRFQSEPSPLVAIYLLSGFASDFTEPEIEPLGVAEGLMTLCRNTYRGYMLSKERLSQEFKLLGRMAANVPIKHIRRPKGLEHLPQLCKVIEEDVQRIMECSS